MRITPIEKYTKFDNRPQVINNKSVPENNNRMQNSISPVYSSNYYLCSFKGAEKTKPIKAFEQFLESFFEENKGKKIQDISTTYLSCDIPSCSSHLINDSFVDMIKSVLNTAKASLINEDLLIGALNSGLQQINISLQDIQAFVEDLKNRGIIAISPNGNELRNIVDEVSHKWIEPLEHSDFFDSMFRRNFYDYILNNNKPVFDTALFESMKSALEEEPFKSFNDKILRIKAQNAANPQTEALEIYNDMLEDKIYPFDNPKMYNQNNEKLDLLLEKIYGYSLDDFLELFNKSGADNKHKVLLIDPGFAAHLEEFIEYIKTKNINTADIEPIELRKSFSDYLGTETVYRGLYSKKPAELIKKLERDGNFASIFKNKDAAVEAIKYYLNVDPEGEDEESVYGRIIDKIKNTNDGSEFLSVSSIYEVAASVPKLSGKPSTPVVVIKAEVPKLSLIKQEGSFYQMQFNQRHRTLKIGDLRLPYDRDMKKIEIFVPFYLPTDKAEITIDTTTSNLQWID